MTCCSRKIFGITIGSLVLLGSVISLIISSLVYAEAKQKEQEYSYSSAIKSIVISLIAIIISCLFIVGLVKRNHYLILPWLALMIGLFWLPFGFLAVSFVGSLMGGASGGDILILILIGLAILAVQFAIFWFSLSLYKEIRNENNENTQAPNVRYQTQEPLI